MTDPVPVGVLAAAYLAALHESEDDVKPHSPTRCCLCPRTITTAQHATILPAGVIGKVGHDPGPWGRMAHVACAESNRLARSERQKARQA